MIEWRLQINSFDFWTLLNSFMFVELTALIGRGFLIIIIISTYQNCALYKSILSYYLTWPSVTSIDLGFIHLSTLSWSFITPFHCYGFNESLSENHSACDGVNSGHFFGQMVISYFRSPSDIFRLHIFWNLTLGNLRLIRWQIQGEFCCYRQFSTS